MRTIVHLSDLHFGAETIGMAAVLAADVGAVSPSLVVISGDFTQRARRSQFVAAQRFVAQLPRPQLAIPGNHDIPLYDVVRRVFFPLNRYRRFISQDVDPVFRDDEMVVMGVNTARSATWKSGRISHWQMRTLGRRLEAAGTRLKVVVTHHPFMPPPDDVGIALVGRAVHAMEVLDWGGVDLLLAGHLHRGYAADVRTKYPAARRGIVSVQAGTAISHRLRRNEANSYNVIRLTPEEIEVEVRMWNGSAYAPLQLRRYARAENGWQEQ